MKVVVTTNQTVNLDASLLNEDGPLAAGQVIVTGAALFDPNEQIVPLVSEYLTRSIKAAGLAAVSAETYGRNIGYMLDHLKSTVSFLTSSYDEILLSVTRQGISRYFAHLREEEGLSSATIRNRDGCIMALFNDFLCIGRDHQPAVRRDNPYAGGYISPPPKKSLVTPCSLQDLKSLILSTASERERCVIQTIFDAGLRRSELGRLTLEAVDIALGFARSNIVSDDISNMAHPDYCPLYVDGSKGRGNEFKPRYSIVSRATLERIKRYHATPLYRKYARSFEHPSETPCFFNSEGKPFNAASVSKLLERLSERAIKNNRMAEAVAPHTLRHGHAYAILGSPDLGRDFLDRLVMTQKSLGHSLPSTTETYTQIPQEIFRLLCPTTGEIPTRAKTMSDLVADTQLKIKLGDKK